EESSRDHQGGHDPEAEREQEAPLDVPEPAARLAEVPAQEADPRRGDLPDRRNQAFIDPDDQRDRAAAHPRDDVGHAHHGPEDEVDRPHASAPPLHRGPLAESQPNRPSSGTNVQSMTSSASYPLSVRTTSTSDWLSSVPTGTSIRPPILSCATRGSGTVGEPAATRMASYGA